MRILRRADWQSQAPGISPCHSVCDMQAARGTPLSGPAAAGNSAKPEDTGQQPVQPAVQPKRRIGIVVGVALLVLALDVVTKIIVVKELSDRAPVRLLGGFLKLTESRNPGA